MSEQKLVQDEDEPRVYMCNDIIFVQDENLPRTLYEQAVGRGARLETDIEEKEFCLYPIFKKGSYKQEGAACICLSQPPAMNIYWGGQEPPPIKARAIIVDPTKEQAVLEFETQLKYFKDTDDHEPLLDDAPESN